MTIQIDLKSQELNDRQILSQIAQFVRKSRKAVVVTGAGISCNAGIPDFRSENGLYNLVKSRFPDAVMKGKDLFDTVLFSNEKSIRVFMSFMAELRKCILSAKSTKTHGFIKKLQEKKKLLRCYTQNIDGLEVQQGLTIGVPKEARALKATSVIQLHGDIHSLRCMLCASGHSWTKDLQEQFELGEAPACPTCQEAQDDRIRNGKRITGIGCLRPDIVLYGEEHPSGAEIGFAMTRDLKSNPDLLLIMGTSLKVIGIRKLVRDVAKTVRSRGGKVILINSSDIGVKSASWRDIIDYHVHGDCDSWVAYLKEEIPNFFEHQSAIPDYMKTSKPKTGVKKKMAITSSILSPPSTPVKSKKFSEIPSDGDCNQSDSSISTPMSPLSQSYDSENLNVESTLAPNALQPIINGARKRMAEDIDNCSVLNKKSHFSSSDLEMESRMHIFQVSSFDRY